MEYKIVQTLTYWVEAIDEEEALEKWIEHPNTSVTEWKDGDIHLSDESIEVNE